MKKAISFILTLIMAISIISAMPNSALANSFESAVEFSIDSPAEGSIVGTEDTTQNYWTKFSCTNTGFYTITLNMNSIPAGDVTIGLFDDTKTQIEYAICNSAVNSYSFTISLEGGKDYFFKYSINGDSISFTTSIANHIHSYTKMDIIKAVASDNFDSSMDGYVRFSCTGCFSSYTSSPFARPYLAVANSTTAAYTGAAITPALAVYDINGGLISADNYTVAYNKNVNPGLASARVIFNNMYYQGEITTRFIITPAAQSLSEVASKKKGQLSIKWNKDLTASGYELQYSTSPKFNKSKTKTVLITKKSTASKTIKSLTLGKKYYVRIRAYKTIKGVNYYGPYSTRSYAKILKK